MHEVNRQGVFDLERPQSDPSPEKVRARLHAMLETVRAAERMPWTPQQALVKATIFPNMANWLPEAEAAELRAAFAAEMDRLRAAS